MRKCVRSLSTHTLALAHTDSLTFDQLYRATWNEFSCDSFDERKKKSHLRNGSILEKKKKPSEQSSERVLTVAAIKMKRKYFIVSSWIFDFVCVHFRGDIRWKNMDRFHGRVCAASDPSRSWSGLKNYFGWWQESEIHRNALQKQVQRDSCVGPEIFV